MSPSPKARLFLLDRSSVPEWEPFALTRPVGELTFGTESLRHRAERVLGLKCAGYVIPAHSGRGHLTRWRARGAPSVFDRVDADSAVPTLVLDARLALERVVGDPQMIDWGAFWGQSGGAVLAGGVMVGWMSRLGEPVVLPGVDAAHAGRGLTPAAELIGTLMEHPWELIPANPDRLCADLAHRSVANDPPGLEAAAAPGEIAEPRNESATGGDGELRPDNAGVPPWTVLGDHPATVAPGARVERGVVLDTRRGPVEIGYGASLEAPSRLIGPVRLGPGVKVMGPARLTGPLSVGAGTTVLGGELDTSSIGRHCRVRGEISHSIIGDYVNKAHDGHIGHSLVGDWVNLGAGTTNSNLKNSYTPVRVSGPEGDRNTGILKMGCMIGDFVRTGIGTLIGAGSVIGAGSNVFGGGLARPFVPPFSWDGPTRSRYRVEELVSTLERMMERRSRRLDPELAEAIRGAWEVYGR